MPGRWRVRRIIVVVSCLVVGFICSSLYIIIDTFFDTGPAQFMNIVASNPHDFKLVINEANKCRNDDGTAKDVFLLVLVHSTPKNADKRALVRDTWGGVGEVDGKRVVTLFLLGKSKTMGQGQRIERESDKHHDLLVEDFNEKYSHLTMKTIMGMKWAANYCSHAIYVMKTDDDMFVGYASIVRYISDTETPTINFMSGLVIRSTPNRNPSSKWYVPESVYPYRTYPPFCSGSGYILSGDLPPKIYASSLETPYLPLEDVFIGICVAKLNVSPVRHIEFNNYPKAYSFCRYRSIFTTHLSSISIQEKYRMWHDFASSEERTCTIFDILHKFRLA